jgi:hypothetical protein
MTTKKGLPPSSKSANLRLRANKKTSRQIGGTFRF